jgi:hypothetical protein
MKNSAEWDIPPWELPGGFRLDARPNRAWLLRRLANAGFVCAVVSYFPFGCVVLICIVESWEKVFGIAAVLGLLGWVLSLMAWLLARADLQEMRTGAMFSDDGETEFARNRAFLSLGLSVTSFVVWGTGALIAYLRI